MGSRQDGKNFPAVQLKSETIAVMALVFLFRGRRTWPTLTPEQQHLKISELPGRHLLIFFF